MNLRLAGIFGEKLDKEILHEPLTKMYFYVGGQKWKNTGTCPIFYGLK